MNSDFLPRVHQEPGLADSAYRKLRDLIVSGEIPAGTRLSAPEIARQMQISRTPARDALTALQRDGLVEIQDRRGAVVVSGSGKDLDQLFDLREVLSGLTARLSASRIMPAGRRQLTSLVEKMAVALERHDEEQLVACVSKFHELLRDCADNRHLALGIDMFGDRLVVLMRSLAHDTSPLTRLIVDDHQAIAAAVVSGDEERAEAAARAHVRHMRERTLSVAPDGERRTK